jgi:cytochrome c-type biogenesis protein CcmH
VTAPVRALALAAALLLAVTASAPAAGPPSAADLEAELVCPTCKTTLDQSNAPVANRMKAIIRQRIAEGATEAEIKAELVDQFGEAVLAEPPRRGLDLLAWTLPLVAVAAGALGVGALAWAWSRRRDVDENEASGPVDPELERRIDDELARFDA